MISSGRSPAETEYGQSVRIGTKTLEDATLTLGSLKQNLSTRKYVNKRVIYEALANNDLEELRYISKFYYNVNGIYRRICDYFAFLYRYDWYTVPEIYTQFEDIEEDRVLKDFAKILKYLDDSNIRKACGDIALTVIKEGAYYGYIVPSRSGVILQQLPIEYCRTRFNVGGQPAIEFNMRFFDTFADSGYRMKVLKMFPEEFLIGYKLYRQNKLQEADDLSSFGIDSNGWYLLNPKNTVKFNFNNNDLPLFVNAVPALLDLDAAQDLDRRKQMQKLLKILVQKLPTDKNGDLIFDVDEARDIHNNAVEMLSRAIGVDVITTFADMNSIDLSDKNTSTTVDDLEKVERTVFNAFGTSRNLFNTDGNMSLERSILNDESAVRNLLLQFEIFFNRIVQQLSASRSRQYSFKFFMLETTQYNYKELSKMYKEQVQIGYSKMLPQIALGHSQSFILNAAHFENEVLHLSEIMIPPLMSSTLSSEDVLGKEGQSTNRKSQTNIEGSSSGAGRPSLPDEQKSDKTIQNQESMS